MRKAVLVLVALLILLFGCVEQPQTGSQTAGLAELTGTNSYIKPIVENWKIFTVLIALATVALVALVRMLSIALNMPDLKAWADVELSEAFVTVLIAAFILVILFSVDSLIGLMLARGQLCMESQSATCAITIAQEYIGGTEQYSSGCIDIANKEYENIMKKAISTSAEANEGLSTTVVWSWAGYATVGWKNQPWKSMEFERYALDLQYLGSIISTMYTQKFIIDKVCGLLAPIMLFIGIPMRAFFFTRKLGGLLIAFGIGFLLVFPATYGLALYTLRTTVYGVGNTEMSGIYCPEMCKTLPPAGVASSRMEYPNSASAYGYYFGTDIAADEREVADKITLDRLTYGDVFEIISSGSPESVDKWTKFLNGDPDGSEISLPGNGGRTYISCNYWQYYGCPTPACMTFPFNLDNDACGRKYGGTYPGISTGGETPESWYAEEACTADYSATVGPPIACNMVRAFEYDPNGGLLEEDPFGNEDNSYKFSRDKPIPGLEQVWDKVAQQIESCPESCRALIPTYLEPDLSECPRQCRWISWDADGNTISAFDDPACLWFKDYCWPYGTDLPGNGEVESIWERDASREARGMWVIPHDALFNQEKCGKCKEVIDPGIVAKPRMFLNCESLCGPSLIGGAKAESVGSLINGVEGFKGKSDVQAVAKLLIPAYVLPIFGLIVTIIFIQALSPLIGGDIEIPGIGGLL